MLLKLKLPFKITGKLSPTPQQALRTFGFQMHPNAIGIVIQHSKYGKLYIRNIFKRKTPFTPNQLAYYSKLKLIALLSKELKTIRKIIWDPIAHQQNFLSGHILFISSNLHRIGGAVGKVGHGLKKPEFQNILITQGPLPPPKITLASYYKNILNLKFKPTPYSTGILILDIDTLKIHHSLLPDFSRGSESFSSTQKQPSSHSDLFPNELNEPNDSPPHPESLSPCHSESRFIGTKNLNPQNSYSITLKLPFKPSSPIIFAYSKFHNLYSNSTSIIPKKNNRAKNV